MSAEWEWVINQKNIQYCYTKIESKPYKGNMISPNSVFLLILYGVLCKNSHTEEISVSSEEYSQAKMTFNAYIHQVNDMQQQLRDNDEELKVLDVKNENAKVAEEMQAAKVSVLFLMHCISLFTITYLKSHLRVYSETFMFL